MFWVRMPWKAGSLSKYRQHDHAHSGSHASTLSGIFGPEGSPRLLSNSDTSIGSIALRSICPPTHQRGNTTTQKDAYTDRDTVPPHVRGRRTNENKDVRIELRAEGRRSREEPLNNSTTDSWIDGIGEEGARSRSRVQRPQF
eukprot:GHVU01103951.1.p1 GENE.GHVU01103951.1~~GHVU01103951.1.p1  ORF type:complete len:142 (+),score=6.29 GHVU01103951.1:229-654(+)